MCSFLLLNIKAAWSASLCCLHFPRSSFLFPCHASLTWAPQLTLYSIYPLCHPNPLPAPLSLARCCHFQFCILIIKFCTAAVQEKKKAQESRNIKQKTKKVKTQDGSVAKKWQLGKLLTPDDDDAWLLCWWWQPWHNQLVTGKKINVFEVKLCKVTVKNHKPLNHKS